ncbi:hypothetical protein Cs7R123_51240 [Catellatospora sp. TT07R-123]|uniref:hemerythrin domain-containing protein n=1 Tax=Catellatospora sp. TT07R-123 TaxID=2733863 RepID=UPI001B20933B|nr:hemerythrin domain-containing protein [Catellatospora sp. TT07R-123]GHJ47782.1 hypothetical protein Cs7R123_51240 [Catellatospora sp. TT07R-123]
MSTTSEPYERIIAYGGHLIDIHEGLREQLARLRADVDAHLAGTAPPPGDLPPRDLPTHCLAFCTALHRHHTAEDGNAFTALARQRPDLVPVLDELRRDHVQINAVLHRLPEILAKVPAAAGDPARSARLRAELGGLAALLESHFTYEERKLVAALDRLDAGGATTGHLLGADPPD